MYDISCIKSPNGYYTYYTIVPKKGISLDENSAYYRLEAKKTNRFNSLRDACKKATFLEELDIPFNVEFADFENMVTDILTKAEED